MSTDDPNNQLAQVEHGALALTNLADNRILSEMVGASLALANESAIAPVDLDALVWEGKRIQRRQGMTPEDVRAFRLFHQAAAGGHIEAQFLLSLCYFHGDGVEKNHSKDIEWLCKAAEAGFQEARRFRTARWIRQ